MQKMWILIGGSAAFLMGVLFFIFTRNSNLSTEIDWRLLGDMDYVTGNVTGELGTFNGQKVRIPGFMVPLEDNSRKVTEFLLVPTPQACIHVPAPPPNQMVHVKVNGDGIPTAFGPIWVDGTFKIVTTKSIYGESAFEMVVDSVEPYP
jgi:hypothetical protein